MRAMCLSMIFSFAVVAGCSGAESPSAEAQVADGVASSARVCPEFCTPEGVSCELPDYTCTEECNACLCTARGGTVVSTCSDAPAAPGGG